MLGDIDAIVTLAVRDLDAAKNFYEGILGLEPVPSDEPEMLAYKSGSTPVMVYRSQHAGTNRATGATWVVDDVDEVVRALKAKGVAFERYDLPETTHDGDVHVAGDLRVAWLKDPDGNILSLVNG